MTWLLGLAATSRAAASDSIVWHTATDRVSADVHGEPLFPLLEDIAHQTGWHIFVEPDAARTVDVKFSNLSSGDALRKLLGNLNFSFVPQTNGPDFLYVFTTVIQNATRPVTTTKKKAKHTANQLMVRVKPGTDIDALAKKYGAKIVGRNDKLHMYLLEFDDQASTDAALTQLQNDSSVESVDYNYIMDPPGAPQSVANAPGGGPPKLTLDAPTDNDPCNPVIGLIDTQVQTLGNGLDQFLMKPVSVVGNVAPVTGTITHGSAMASTMLNAISQASGGHSSTRILPVNVYDSGDSTTSWNVALGVQAAVDGGATVLNMSLGGTDNSSVLADVVQQAMAQGIIVFASAGNTPVATPTYPAAIPGVNAITALGAPGQLASYANYGSFVEMALPGTSFVYLGDQAYEVQGTSPASAYASGIAAGTKTVNCAGWSQILPAMAQKFPVPAK
ncbi:MAG TPA: S8 family serine peptidase [Verrucomicrobiae bacterium]